MKLAIVATHPVQYHVPVYRLLAGKQGLEIRVFWGCNHGTTPTRDPNFNTVFKWDMDLEQGVPHTYISQEPLSSLENWKRSRELSRKAVEMIRDFSPDAILFHSYKPHFITLTTLRARALGKPLFLRAETTDHAIPRSWLKDALRSTILRWYYRHFSVFFPIGSHSRDHYLRHGVREARLSTALYSVDADFLKQQADKWKPRRRECRERYGIPADAYVFIYCAKMHPPKNPLIIPEALKRMPSGLREKAWFLVVGDGVLSEQMQKGCTECLGERAIFTGFLNQSELGSAYASSDCLVLPSSSGETWGLVVNEALHYGLRVIVSDRVGSARDLIRSNNEGWVFPSGEAQALADSMGEALGLDKPQQPLTLPHPKDAAEAISQSVMKLATA